MFLVISALNKWFKAYTKHGAKHFFRHSFRDTLRSAEVNADPTD